MSTDSVKLSLELATKAAEDALKRFQAQTKETTKTFDIFKGTLGAQAAFSALSAGFNAVSGVLSSMVSEAMNAEASVKRMEIALEQAGLAGQGNSKYFQDLADSIEATTIYSGDAVEASVALFASLNNLSRDGIEQATKLTVDFAAAFGKSLPEASEMVSKAVNGNMTAFNKLGISIQKGTTDAETLANVTKALAQYQGSAVKSAETFEGAVTKLNNQKGKLLEAFGKLVTQNPAVISAMEGLTDIFVKSAEYIEANKENITLLLKSFAASGAIVATAGAAWVAYNVIVGATTVGFTGITVAAKAAWAAVTGPVGLAIGAIAALGVAIYAVVKYWDNIKVATYEATAAVLEYAAKAAGVFSKSTGDSLNAEAKALRDKAAATRELIAEEAKQKQQEQASPETQTTSVNAKLEIEELKLRNAEKLALQKDFNNQSVLADLDMRLQLQELEAQHLETMRSMNEGFTLTDLEAQFANDQQRLLARQDFERQSLQATQDAQLAKIKLIDDTVKREQELQQFKLKSQLDNEKLANKQQLDLTKQRYKTEEQLNAKRISDQKSTFSTIAGLANSSNKELAAVGKAFALYNIGVDTAQGVMKAWALGPIIGPPLAGLVAAAGAAQAAQVAGLKFEQGGIVPGTSFKGDRITAGVNSREMVLNMEQQRNLFKMANGQQTTSSGSNDETNALLAAILSAVKSGTTIEINGREIVNVVKSELGSGRSISAY